MRLVVFSLWFVVYTLPGFLYQRPQFCVKFLTAINRHGTLHHCSRAGADGNLVQNGTMKKYALLYLLLLLLTACGRRPEVFSVNNFSMISDSERLMVNVKELDIPDIKGEWMGLEHRIEVDTTNSINGLHLYSVQLIDTARNKDSGAVGYDIHFMSVAGKPYIELINWQHDPHGMHISTSTYLKIKKITADTIIVQMPISYFTEGWLQAKGYNFFVLADEKYEKGHAVYLTEEPERLAILLKELYHVKRAFNSPDTIIRSKVQPVKRRSVEWPPN